MKQVNLLMIISVSFLLGVFASGCEYWTKDNIVGPDNGGEPGNGNGNTTPTVFYLTDIQPIFDARCVNCHGNQGGLDLTSYDALMAGGNSGSIVTPGDGASSLLVKRIAGSILPQMPLGAPALTDDEINLIRTWIDEGALNN